MKKFTLKLTALILALLMTLSFVLVSCDETETLDDEDDVEETDGDKSENKDDESKDENKDDDGSTDNDKPSGDSTGSEGEEDNGSDNTGDNGGNEGESKPDVGYEGDEIDSTKENAKILFVNAVNKFKNNTSVKYTVQEDINGEIETDTITVFTNANGDIVYYEITDIGNQGFEYTYATGLKEYFKGPWGVDEYELDEKVTMQFAIEDVFEYIFEAEPEDAIDNLCKSAVNVKKEGDMYVIWFETDNARDFFMAMLGEETTNDMAEDIAGLSDFNGKIKIEFYADGNLSEITFSYSATMAGKSVTMGYVYSFEKYNDPSITVEKPDWVIERENSGDEGEEDEGGAFPEYPDKPGNEEGGDTQVTDVTPLVNAMRRVVYSDTLKLIINSSDGETTESIIITSVTGEDGTHKVYGTSEGYEIYIDAEGNIYEYSGGTASKTPSEYDALDFVFENFLECYAFSDVDAIMPRLIAAGLKGVSDGKNTIYTLDTTYVKLYEIIDPNLANDASFQQMISMIKSSSVSLVYVIDASGSLSRTESSALVDLGDFGTLTIEERVDYFVNQMVRFTEPEWIVGL